MDKTSNGDPPATNGDTPASDRSAQEKCVNIVCPTKFVFPAALETQIPHLERLVYDLNVYLPFEGGPSARFLRFAR